MKAFRNVGGNVVEIEIDQDPQGNPILPPDTTVDPRPAANPGHYVTVVDTSWVQIPIPVENISFETKKANAVAQVQKYRDWYINTPIDHDGQKFDADETARNRLAQAIVVYNTNATLPPAWITADNQAYALADLDALKGVLTAVQNAFLSRFFEMNTLRASILAAADETALNAITIPTIPTGL